MAKWRAEVQVWLKPSVFDPQGNAVERALSTLGHKHVSDVRIGKTIQLYVVAEKEEDAAREVAQMCETVLCNPVIETYAYTLANVSEVTS